jgi:hypothetical protein
MTTNRSEVFSCYGYQDATVTLETEAWQNLQAPYAWHALVADLSLTLFNYYFCNPRAPMHQYKLNLFMRVVLDTFPIFLFLSQVIEGHVGAFKRVCHCCYCHCSGMSLDHVSLTRYSSVLVWIPCVAMVFARCSSVSVWIPCGVMVFGYYLKQYIYSYVHGSDQHF